jgi:hypothetical protein
MEFTNLCVCAVAIPCLVWIAAAFVCSLLVAAYVGYTWHELSRLRTERNAAVTANKQKSAFISFWAHEVRNP